MLASDPVEDSIVDDNKQLLDPQPVDDKVEDIQEQQFSEELTTTETIQEVPETETETEAKTETLIKEEKEEELPALPPRPSKPLKQEEEPTAIDIANKV